MSSDSLGSIGPYRLEKLLGRGGMGEVYRARDERLGRDVAVKHVRDDVAGNPAARSRLRREARAVALLNHPAIVQIFDILEGDDGEWIVMEFVDGPTLAELLDEGPLEPLEALEWGEQIAHGLSAAHEKGILHRDLKTENVMIAPGGQAKILDFGLAKPLDDEDFEVTASVSADGEIIGTCRAMSPEQARGLELDRRSDLFSLGSLLYEMVTGEAPFLASSAVLTLSRVCTHQPPPVSSLEPALPPALDDLIARLLEKAPELRPVSAGRVAGRLARMARKIRAETTTAIARGDEELFRENTETATAAIPVAARQRRITLWAVGSLMGLGLILFLAFFLTARDRDAHDPPVAGLVTSSTTDSWELYRRGIALLSRPDKEGHVENAIAIFNGLLERDADSAPALAGLARAYWRKYREVRVEEWLERARETAEKAVAADEYFAAGRVSLGLIAAEEGRDEEAESELEAALVLDPTNADAHHALARLHRQRGDLDAAETAIRNAIAGRPEDREFYDFLGAVLFRVGRYPEAETAFRKSVDLAPDSVYGHRNLAAVLAQEKRYDEASAALQKALEIAPDRVTYSNLGTLLFYQGLYERAATAFEKALALTGGASRSIIWGNLGDARRASGSHEDAAKAYRRAVRLLEEELETAPEDSERESRLALYFAKLGDERRAHALLEELDSGIGTHASVLYRIAVAWEVCGERERAREVLERALAAGYAVEDARRDPELADLRGEAL